MAAGFKIDTDLVRPGADDFRSAGEALGRVVAEFTSTLAGLDAMVGDDKYGRAFAKGYDPDSRAVLEAAARGPEVLLQLGEGVIVMADNDDALDETNAGNLRRGG